MMVGGSYDGGWFSCWWVVCMMVGGLCDGGGFV